jgi:hypothetical protein
MLFITLSYVFNGLIFAKQRPMKKIFFSFFLLIPFFCSAQEDSIANQGTVKVRKTGTLHSVLYDDVNFRLVGRDIYGNIIDTAVISFDLNVTVKGIAYSEKTAGCFLSKEMQIRLSRMDGLVILMFSNIKAKDKYGRIVSFPDFKTKSGNERERNDY